MATAVLVVGMAALGLLVGALISRRLAVSQLEQVVAGLGPDPVDWEAGTAEADGSVSRRQELLAGLARRVEIERARLGVQRGERARLAEALQAVPQGVVICDRAGTEMYRNQAAVAYVRGRHGEAVVEQAIQELAAAGGPVEDPRRLEIYGPPRRVLVLCAHHLGQGEGDQAMVIIVDDVSERVRLEAIRRDFVANLSHELKTPVGALGLLADAISAETDPEVISRLSERMNSEAFRVGRIIDDLLDLSRIEAEEVPVSETVPVTEVVAEALERVRPQAEARNIAVALGELSRQHRVTGDRRQLVSALANLLDNACKYSDVDSRVEVRSWEDGGFVEIEVRDLGIGIPGRDLERVFERFYRVDRARSRETGGTGLGLAIVRHVASNHRGEVRVASREGEGSVFTLRLPIDAPAIDAPAVDAPPVAPGTAHVPQGDVVVSAS